MPIRSIFLIILLFSFEAKSKSFLDNESVVCPENNIIYKGIHCCIGETENSLTESTCKASIDSLSFSVVAKINEVQTNYYNGVYDYGAVPNCYWFSSFYLRFFDEVEEARVTTSNELLQFMLKEGFVNDEPLTQESVAILYFLAEERFYLETPSGGLRLSWERVEFLGHALIHLGDSLVLQKENIGTSVFSLSTIEETKKAYKRAFGKESRYRNVEARVEVWNPK